MEEIAKNTDDYEHKKTNVVNTLTEYQEVICVYILNGINSL